MTKREKKKNSRRKLLLLVLLLFVSVLLITVSTVAWFTANKTVSVDSLDVQARTTNGLEISADAVNWGISINKSDLINNEWDGHRNQLPSILDHVSTVGNLHTDANNNYIQMFDGEVETTCKVALNPDGSCDQPIYSLTTTEAFEMNCYDKLGDETNNDEGTNCGAHNKYFMAFDIYLKVNRDTHLFMTTNAGVKEKNGDHGIKNAVRVAFLNRGHVDSDTYYAGDDGIRAAQALNEAGDVYIWEPNYNTHTRAGVTSATTYFGVAATQFNGTESASPIEYFGIKEAFDTPVELNQTNGSTHVQKVTPQIQSMASHNELDTGIDLQAGVTKIRVYFWVEGQDVDTENNATGYNMLLDLEFAIH